MQEILIKIRYIEGGLSKSLQKVLFFLSNLVRFDGQGFENKRGLELVISHYSGFKKLLY